MPSTVVARVFLTCVMLLVPATATFAGEEGKALELRRIMKDLGTDMQKITDAISREDWPAAEALAQRVADHPQPGMLEKTRVLAFIGTRVTRFKAYDGETHRAAKDLADAASRSDGVAAIEAFRRVQLGCHGCHQAFRREFVNHFYPSEKGSARP